jgi:hypothetical protein
VNDNGAVVGQLVGSGVNVTIGGTLEDPLQICLEEDTDIPVNPDYTEADFGILVDDVLTPLDAGAIISGTQLCANVTESGFYFPIYRLLLWQDAENSTTGSEPVQPVDPVPEDSLEALWICLAVVFFLAIVLVVVCLARSAMRTNSGEEAIELISKQD